VDALPAFVDRHPWITGALALLASFAALVLAFPAVFPGDPEGAFVGGLRRVHAPVTEKDPVLGVRAKAGVSLTTLVPHTGDTPVTYTTTPDGRRTVPVPDGGSRGRFLLFFGCSYTFGYGLNDGETLPAYAAPLAPGYRPYNFGFIGYGPQHMYCQLAEKDALGAVGEGTGTAVYVYLSDHVHRLIGSTDLFNLWMEDHPYLHLSGGELVHDGSFEQGRPLTSMWQRFVWARRRISPLPPRSVPDDGDCRLLARVVSESERVLKARKPGSRLVVLLYPDPDGEASLTDRVAGELKKEGVAVLDGRGVFPTDGAHFFPDNHPRAEANRKMAEFLAAFLEEETPPSEGPSEAQE
jgi:hypothetical protein